MVVSDEKVKLIPFLLNRQRGISLLYLLSITPPHLLAFMLSSLDLYVSSLQDTECNQTAQSHLLCSLLLLLSPLYFTTMCVFDVCACKVVCMCFVWVLVVPAFLPFSLSLSLITHSISHLDVCVWESVHISKKRQDNQVQTVRDGSWYKHGQKLTDYCDIDHDKYINHIL